MWNFRLENMDEDKKIVVFKSLNESLSSSFMAMVLMIALSFNFIETGAFFYFYLSCLSVIFYLYYHFFKNRKAVFKLKHNCISICNNGKCRNFDYEKIKNFNLEKSRIFGPSLAFTMHDGRVIKFLFYTFNNFLIYKELVRQKKIPVKDAIVDSVYSECRVDTYIRILYEKDKTVFKKILFMLIGIMGSIILGLFIHSSYMSYFSHTNFGLGYFVSIWGAYSLLFNTASLAVFLTYTFYDSFRIRRIRAELIKNYPHMSFKKYKQHYKKGKDYLLFPVTYLLLVFAFHVTPLTYLAPIPKVHSEIVSNAILNRSWLDMRYICQDCDYPITTGNVVFYYDEKEEIKIGVASAKQVVPSRQLRNLASVKDVEVFVDSFLNKRKIPSGKILGIARNYKGIVLVKF